MEEVDLLDLIETAYRESGNRLGWRLLYSPASVIHSARVAFVGLNPGGSAPDLNDGLFCSGSAYVTESWLGRPAGQHHLQKRVVQIFDALGVAPEETLAGNLVPFRSPNWNSLARRDFCLEFGMRLWRGLLDAARPNTVIAMGGEAQRAMSKLLHVSRTHEVLVGHGNVKGTWGQADDIRFVGLPHLSRFRVTEPALNELLDFPDADRLRP